MTNLSNAIANFGMRAGNNLGNAITSGVQQYRDDKRENRLLQLREQEKQEELARAQQQQNALFAREDAQIAERYQREDSRNATLDSRYQQSQAEKLKNEHRAFGKELSEGLLRQAPEDRAQYYAGALQHIARRWGDDHGMPEEYTDDVIPLLMGRYGGQAPEVKPQTEIEKLNRALAQAPPGSPQAQNIQKIIDTKTGQDEKSILEKDKLQEEIEAKRAKAAADAKESAEAEKVAINQAQTMLNLGKALIGSDEALDGLRAFSGLRGLVPLDVMPSSRSYGGKLDQFRNNLTLEKLPLLTGVLSDTDILLLERAGTAFREGGEFDQNFEEIVKVLQKLEDGLEAKGVDVQRTDWHSYLNSGSGGRSRSGQGGRRGRTADQLIPRDSIEQELQRRGAL